MTPAQIAELRRLAEAATPGPWRADGCELIGDSTILATLCWHTGRDTENEADKALIVALRNGVRGILAERDALVRVAEAGKRTVGEILNQLRVSDSYAREANDGPVPSVWQLQNAHLRNSANEWIAALATTQEKPDA